MESPTTPEPPTSENSDSTPISSESESVLTPPIRKKKWRNIRKKKGRQGRSKESRIRDKEKRRYQNELLLLYKASRVCRDCGQSEYRVGSPGVEQPPKWGRTPEGHPVCGDCGAVQLTDDEFVGPVSERGTPGRVAGSRHRAYQHQAYFREKLAQYTNTDPRIDKKEDRERIIGAVYKFWRDKDPRYRFKKSDIGCVLAGLKDRELAKKRENSVQILVMTGLLDPARVPVIDKDVKREMAERYTVFVRNYLVLYHRRNITDKRKSRRHVPSVPFCILQMAWQVSDELYEKIRVWTPPVKTYKTLFKYNNIFDRVIQYIITHPGLHAGTYIRREESRIDRKDRYSVEYSKVEYTWRPAKGIQYGEIKEEYV